MRPVRKNFPEGGCMTRTPMGGEKSPAGGRPEFINDEIPVNRMGTDASEVAGELS